MQAVKVVCTVLNVISLPPISCFVEKLPSFMNSLIKGPDVGRLMTLRLLLKNYSQKHDCLVSITLAYVITFISLFLSSIILLYHYSYYICSYICKNKDDMKFMTI